MISTTFNSGNYNNWDELVSSILPAKNNILRQVAIPAIDNTLLSMLGVNAQIEKSQINVVQKCDKEGLLAADFVIRYTCEDFKAPEAPEAAIEKDTNAILEAVRVDGLTLVSCSIDVQTGVLSITYEAVFRGK